MHDDPSDFTRLTRLPRRDLLGTTVAALAGAGLAGCARMRAVEREERTEHGAERGLVSPGDVVLFQGDSITDAGRSRQHADLANEQPALGGGYAWLAGAGLLVGRALHSPAGGEQPDHQAGAGVSVYNRGISGNKVFQLADRWDPDCLALRPDVLSILIGVNDIWHARGGGYAGTVEIYERDYDALLARTRTALPHVKLVVCEPFVLRCGAVDDSWFPEFDLYRAAAHRVAATHAATWVPLQAMFDEAVRYAPPEHWASDGVHPTSAGAALMAQTWLRAVGA